MSLAITSKLKYPGNFHREEEGDKNSFTKEGASGNNSLLNQMQNLKLNKYSKYLQNKDKIFFDGINRIKESKRGLIPTGKSTRKEIKEGRTSRNEEVEAVEHDTMVLETSLLSLVKGAKRPASQIDNIESQAFNFNNYFSCPNGNNLEIIVEQDTQRTDTNNDTIHKSPHSNLNLNNSCEHLTKSFSCRKNSLNPQYSLDYMMDIYHNLLLEEKNLPSMFGYMAFQTDLNEKMRAILIDWIIDVHLKFKLTPETLFLTVNLIDRYLMEKVIDRNKLQLIGVAALLIACKYEEIFSPELRDFEHITDRAYNKDEIVSIEVEMLKLFQFNITVPSSYRFFEIIAEKLHFNSQEFTFGRYLLEMFLIDYRYTKYFPSQIACAVSFLVLNFFHNENQAKACYYLKEFLDMEMNQSCLFICYEAILKECCKDICFLFENIDNTQLLTVKKKFITAENYSVSRFTTRIGG